MIINPRSNLIFSKIFLPRRAFSPAKYPGESTFGLIKPDGTKNLPEIFDILHSEGFYIRGLRMSKFNQATAKAFYEEHVDQDYFEKFREYLISGPIIGLRLGRLDAIDHWRKVMGSRNPEIAKEENPESIRAKFATSERINCVHGADSQLRAVKELSFFFGPQSLMTRLPPVYPNTILMLRPQLMTEGKLGSIIKSINDSGCKVDAMQMFDSEEIEDLKRKMGDDAPKVLKVKISVGHSLLMEISHPKGYEKLLEEMLRVENVHGTGYTHFDKGDERLSEKIFY
jgi:nucleoside diphosphate kinase